MAECVCVVLGGYEWHNSTNNIIWLYEKLQVHGLLM